MSAKSPWLFFLPLTIFVLDRFIKLHLLQSRQLEVPLIPQFLKIALYKNYGIGFSLQFPQTLTIILSLIIIAALFIWLFKTKNPDMKSGSRSSASEYRDKKTRIALVFIIIGAISNLVDRLLYGFVIDYISLFNLSFLNLSDLLIFTAVVLLII